jgi:hypothetical protein
LSVAKYILSPSSVIFIVLIVVVFTVFIVYFLR